MRTAQQATLVALATLMIPPLLACGDGGTEPEPPQPNRAPVAQGSISAHTVAVGESVTVSVASAFSDPDGDALTYAAAGSAPGVASVAVSGTDLTVTGVAKGNTNITVTASDPDGLSAQQVFQVTVPNRPPEVTDGIPDQTLRAGDTVSVNLGEHFGDPDGDGLTYTAESSAADVASVAVSGSVMTIDGTAVGTATVSVTATDPQGQSASLALEVTVRPSERAVLELFYEATGGENWIRADNWLTNAPLGEWYGVTVNDEGAVVSLDLPVSLFDLFDWDGNGLTGSIPPELGLLSALEVLDLSDNELTGPIPTELADLSALKALDLEFNELTGPVPRELSELSTLEYLDLGVNDLTGPIPPELGRLSALEVLDLCANELTGSIPQSLARLSALERLRLCGPLFSSSPGLTGSIPAELGQLSALEVLDLSSNGLTGAIPRELGQLSELVHLGLSLNDLTGPIPTELARLSKLQDLWLSHNDLAGSIPADLGQLSQLGLLSVTGNGLTGAVPSELGQLVELGNLYLARNKLTGRIPDSFLGLDDLSYFDFGDNDGLCAPGTAAFDAWLAGMTSWSGPRCATAYANRAQTVAASDLIRHLEELLATATRSAQEPRDRREALEARKLMEALRSQMEESPNRLRNGPHGRRDAGPR